MGCSNSSAIITIEGKDKNSNLNDNFKYKTKLDLNMNESSNKTIVYNNKCDSIAIIDKQTINTNNTSNTSNSNKKGSNLNGDICNNHNIINNNDNEFQINNDLMINKENTILMDLKSKKSVENISKSNNIINLESGVKNDKMNNVNLILKFKLTKKIKQRKDMNKVNKSLNIDVLCDNINIKLINSKSQNTKIFKSKSLKHNSNFNIEKYISYFIIPNSNNNVINVKSPIQKPKSKQIENLETDENNKKFTKSGFKFQNMKSADIIDEDIDMMENLDKFDETISKYIRKPDFKITRDLNNSFSSQKIMKTLKSMNSINSLNDIINQDLSIFDNYNDFYMKDDFVNNSFLKEGRESKTNVLKYKKLKLKSNKSLPIIKSYSTMSKLNIVESEFNLVRSKTEVKQKIKLNNLNEDFSQINFNNSFSIKKSMDIELSRIGSNIITILPSSNECMIPIWTNENTDVCLKIKVIEPSSNGNIKFLEIKESINKRNMKELENLNQVKILENDKIIENVFYRVLGKDYVRFIENMTFRTVKSGPIFIKTLMNTSEENSKYIILEVSNSEKISLEQLDNRLNWNACMVDTSFKNIELVISNYEKGILTLINKLRLNPSLFCEFYLNSFLFLNHKTKKLYNILNKKTKCNALKINTKLFNKIKTINVYNQEELKSAFNSLSSKCSYNEYFCIDSFDFNSLYIIIKLLNSEKSRKCIFENCFTHICIYCCQQFQNINIDESKLSHCNQSKLNNSNVNVNNTTMKLLIWFFG